MRRLKFFLINIILFWPSFSWAQNGGLNEFGETPNLGNDTPVIETLAKILNILLGFLGVIVVVGIIYGGFRMMTAVGNEEQSADGRKIVVAGVVGLIIILAAYAIASFVVSNLAKETGASI